MEKKKTVILTVIAGVTLIALVVGATFAYFQAQGGTATSADVRVTTYTTDLLTFTTGDDIAIYADQANFAEGLGNRSGETFAKAHLLANSKTNSATANYYVYLNVTDNTFEYTQADETAELLLQVTNPNGAEVTTLSGLEYKTVIDGKGNEVKGFDVTTFDGLITIADNYEIVANNEATQTWNVKLVFVNLDADQTDNAGHSLNATLKVQKEKESTTLANWVIAQYTGTQGTNNLYYHDSNLTNGAGDDSYRYAGASDTTNNFVCFGSTATTCPDDNLYRIIGVFGDQVKLIKWDYATSTLLGTDGDYSTTCSAADYCGGDYGTSKGTNTEEQIGAYNWNYANYSATYNATNYYNVWSYSKLNTVNLNTNYINNIGTTWANKIASTTWKVGGNTWANIGMSNAKTAYTNEITSPVTINGTTTETSKIGLMYVSDYYYGASPTYWTYPGYDSNGSWNDDYTVWTGNDYSAATGENWMYMGLNEWTVVRQSASTRSAFAVSSDGDVNSYDRVDYSSNAWGARPVFHLESFVTYDSGSGSKSDPVRLN